MDIILLLGEMPITPGANTCEPRRTAAPQNESTITSFIFGVKSKYAELSLPIIMHSGIISCIVISGGSIFRSAYF